LPDGSALALKLIVDRVRAEIAAPSSVNALRENFHGVDVHRPFRDGRARFSIPAPRQFAPDGRPYPGRKAPQEFGFPDHHAAFRGAADAVWQWPTDFDRLSSINTSPSLFEVDGRSRARRLHNFISLKGWIECLSVEGFSNVEKGSKIIARSALPHAIAWQVAIEALLLAAGVSDAEIGQEAGDASWRANDETWSLSSAAPLSCPNRNHILLSSTLRRRRPHTSASSRLTSTTDSRWGGLLRCTRLRAQIRALSSTRRGRWCLCRCASLSG
jgi:hypothetical protein